MPPIARALTIILLIAGGAVLALSATFQYRDLILGVLAIAAGVAWLVGK